MRNAERKIRLCHRDGYIVRVDRIGIGYRLLRKIRNVDLFLVDVIYRIEQIAVERRPFCYAGVFCGKGFRLFIRRPYHRAVSCVSGIRSY